MIDSATRVREHRSHVYDPAGIGPDPRRNPSDGSSPLMFVVNGYDDDTSPKLWKTSPAATPPPMSPSSRTEAVARGRRELMEMIKDMPESLYELSLRDIVDQVATAPEDDFVAMRKTSDVADQKKKKAAAAMGRSRSADNGGYLLKTSVFPISFGMMRRRRKKKILISSGSLKAVKGGAEKEWWRRKASESDLSGMMSSTDSDRSSGTGSGNSSRSSSSNGRRHGQGKLSNRFLLGCCSFKGNK